MKKYLDQLIALNLLIQNNQEQDKIDNLYKTIMNENNHIIKETIAFAQVEQEYLNFHDATVVDIKYLNKKIEISLLATTFHKEQGVEKKNIFLDIKLKMTKSIKLQPQDTIHTVIVHNNQLGIVYKRQNNTPLMADIIDFKTIAIQTEKIPSQNKHFRKVKKL